MTDTRGDWATEAVIRQLRIWWADLTMSTAEMGRRFGVSKNALVGKAHRLGLDPRPSPIVPGYRRLLGAPKPAPVVRREVPALAPLASLGPLAAVKTPSWAPARIAARPSAVPVKPVAVPVVPRVRTEPCCWVTTEGGRGKPWLYCNAESEPGKPFCPAHTKLAYVKIRDRREDVAHAMGGD